MDHQTAVGGDRSGICSMGVGKFHITIASHFFDDPLIFIIGYIVVSVSH